MLLGKRLIIIVSDSSSTMSREDWDRLYNCTAGTADNRIVLSAPTFPPQVEWAFRPEQRDKNYWKPKYERFKKRKAQ